MKKGTVKWFDPRKGYGFIVQEDGTDIFVHYSSIAGEGFKTLNEGAVVVYDEGIGNNGRKVAINVANY